MSSASIARPPVAVKGHSSPVEGSELQEPGPSPRPNVLDRMPPSCRVVFDLLRSLGGAKGVKLSIRQLAEMAQLSPAQTWRALRRLHGANLVNWQTSGPGRGGRSFVELNWHEVSFPQKNVSSKSQADYAVGKQTPEAPIYSEKYIITKEGFALKSTHSSPLNWENDDRFTRQIEPARPLWPDAAPWCTRPVWSRLAGQVRRRSVELWGPHYGGVATDAIMATAARAVRGGLIKGEDELRELVRHLGGRLRESGHAIGILSDRPRAFAFLGGVARRWLRRRGRLQEPAPEGMSTTDWPKWQEAAFEVLEELSWTWERREKPLGDVAGIVAKVQRVWLETPPDRLHRRGWELVESLSWRGFALEESRWLAIAGLASALGVPMPEPPRRPRDPFTRRMGELQEQGYTVQEAREQASREFLGGLIWA